MRRIEAVTGTGVLKYIDGLKGELNETAAILKVNNPSEIAKRCETLLSELKESRRALESLNAKLAGSKLTEIMKTAEDIKGVRVAVAVLEGVAPDELRKMSDTVKSSDPLAVVVLASVNGDKVTFCAACGAEAIAKGAHAGNIVRETAAVTGGKGGGKPDSAMAGGKDTAKVEDAVKAVPSIVEALIK